MLRKKHEHIIKIACKRFKNVNKIVTKIFWKKKRQKKKTENMGEINTKACLKKKTETKRTGKI